MKQFFSKLALGGDNRVSGAIALYVVALIALGCTCAKDLDFSNLSSNSSNTTRSGSSDVPADTSDSSDPNMPGDELIVALVNETTADFNLAVTTGDFSDLYDKASLDFRNTYTLDEVKDIFKDFVKNKRVVSPILAEAVSKEPELIGKPYLRSEKGLDILVVNGKYKTKRVPTNFEYEYVMRGGDWKLLKLIVKLE